MIVRFVGGPWDGREEERADRPFVIVKTDAVLVDIYTYVDVGDSADGAALFQLERAPQVDG